MKNTWWLILCLVVVLALGAVGCARGASVSLEANGANTNTAIHTAAVMQIPPSPKALSVDLSAPAEVTVGDDYYVTAVVTNPNYVEASGVNATLEIEGDASTLDRLEQVIGNILPSSSANVSWMLTADAEGGVTVIVTADGTNTGIGVDSAAIQQRNGIKWDELEVVPTYGYAPLQITASVMVSNSGDMATTTEAELYVDGEVVASQIVSLGAGARWIVSFDYVLAAGTYNVTINGLPPIEVVVLLPPPLIYEGANPIIYPGTTADFPHVLTNIGPAGLDVALIIWLRDTSTGGAWWFYNVPQDYSHPAEFTGMVTGKVYIVVVSEDCVWYVS
jgi:hypothetical protein